MANGKVREQMTKTKIPLRLDVKKAWYILHSLETKLEYLEYLLLKTNSRGYSKIPKHMLDMVFEYIKNETTRVKSLIVDSGVGKTWKDKY
jgi:hypothetical protein